MSSTKQKASAMIVSTNPSAARLWFVVGSIVILCCCIQPIVAPVCDGLSFSVVPTLVMPSTTFVYECQNTSIYLAMVNVSITGYNNLGAPVTGVTGWDSFQIVQPLTVTPLLVASPLVWNPTPETCTALNSNAIPTTQYCQIVLQLTGFTGGGQDLDYETLFSTGFSYQTRLVVKGSRNSGCTWTGSANLTVYIKDCDEYPKFDPTIPTTVQIAEYSGSNSTYAGSIVNLLVNDPDVFSTVYGNVTLSIVSITRPNKGGQGVDPTPFYISGFNFLYANNNASALNYDVSRCPVVSTCLGYFDSLYDNGGLTPYYSLIKIVIQAEDGGGLKVSYTVTVNVTQVPQTPQFLTLPGSVSIAEDIGTGIAQRIFPIQVTIPRLGANTWSIQVLNVNPPVSGAGTYIANSSGALTTCSPAPSLPVLCAPLVLTTSVVSTTFNYLLVKQYNVTVWAINIPPSGSGLIPVTASSSILVNITMKNYEPTLTPSSVFTVLTEDVATQACIYNISNVVSDLNNDTVFYYNSLTITSTGGAVANGMWYLNGSQICYNGLYASRGTCCNRVFRSTDSPYTLQVTVKDAYATPTPNTFTLSVSIIKVDDPPILYVPTTTTVPETWTNFTFNVNATQQHPSSSTSPLVFALVAWSTTYNNQTFYITAQNSTINVGYATIGTIGIGPEYFAFLSVPIIYVNISVTDGIYTVQGTTIVYVQYVNRAPVVLNLPNSTSLLETTTGYAPLYTVSTYDKESDPRIYQFVTTSGLSQTDASTYFSIDYNLGVIYYVNPAFEWYTKAKVYTLAVLVQDTPSPPQWNKNASTMANYTVSITMVDQAPYFTNPVAGTGSSNSTISIYENVTGQAFIYTFRATDRESDTIYYNITTMRPTTNTAFNLAWGQNQLEYNNYYASTSPMFNNTIIPVYWIVVEVKDAYHMNSATSTTTLTVSILHVNRSALWTSLPGYVSIREDVYYGPTDLYTVGAIDPNYGYSVTISYLGITPTSGSSKFYFNTTTNALGYNQNPGFSYGTQNSYTALFTAFNGIYPVVTSSVAITIYKINTGPFSNTSRYNYTVWIREDQTSGMLLWDLRVQSNQSLSLSYSIQDITPTSGSFTVTSSGLVKLLDKPTFNYQKAPNYVLHILALDTGLGGGQQSERSTFSLTVSIIAVAKTPTITNLPNFVSIREGYPGSGTIYLTKCTDPAGNSLSWSYNVLPTSGLKYFSIAQNGTVSTTSSANFTYLLQPQYLVVVMCGNSDLTTTGTLTVAIIWTTSTSTTTTTKAPTIYVTETTTAASSSSGLTSEQIGAIAGSLGGALLLAGVAFGIAQAMQKKALADGLTQNMKQVAAVNEIELN